MFQCCSEVTYLKVVAFFRGAGGGVLVWGWFFLVLRIFPGFKVH